MVRRYYRTGSAATSANRQLSRLEQSIETRLYFHPRKASPQEPGVVDYVGLSRAVEEWTREIGFRSSLTVAAAAKALDVGDR